MKNKIILIGAIGAMVFIVFFVGRYYGVSSQTLENEQQSENSALNVYKVGEGDVLSDKEGIDGESEEFQVYKNGEDVFLTPYPTEGFYFYSWVGCNGVYAFNNICWVSMNESKTVTAVFEQSDKKDN